MEDSFYYRLVFSVKIKSEQAGEDRDKDLTLENNVDEKFIMNSVYYTMTLGGITFNRKIYQPGEIEAEVAIEAQNNNEDFCPKVSDISSLLLRRTVELHLVKKDKSSTKINYQLLAKNYYVYELNPRLVRQADGSKRMFVRLSIFSMDKLMTIDKYSKAYVAKKLGSGILGNERKNFGLGEDKVKVNYENLCHLRYQQSMVVKQQTKDFFDNAYVKDVLINIPSEFIQPYLIQYNETFYDFISRTANRCGEFLYFEDGQLTMGVAEKSTPKLIDNYQSLTYQNISSSDMKFGLYARDSMKDGNGVMEDTNYDRSKKDAAGYPVDAFPQKAAYHSELTNDEYLFPLYADKFTTFTREMSLAGDAGAAASRQIFPLLNQLLSGCEDYAAFLVGFGIDEAKTIKGCYDAAKESNENGNEKWITQNATGEQGDGLSTVPFGSVKPEGWTTLRYYGDVHRYQEQLQKDIICIDMGENIQNVKLGQIITISEGGEPYVVIQDLMYGVDKWSYEYEKYDANGGIEKKDGGLSQKIFAIPMVKVEDKQGNMSMKAFPPVLPVPVIRRSEPQTAFITDNSDPKFQGRVRIIFPWQAVKMPERQAMADAQLNLEEKMKDYQSKKAEYDEQQASLKAWRLASITKKRQKAEGDKIQEAIDQLDKDLKQLKTDVKDCEDSNSRKEAEINILRNLDLKKVYGPYAAKILRKEIERLKTSTIQPDTDLEYKIKSLKNTAFFHKGNNTLQELEKKRDDREKAIQDTINLIIDKMTRTSSILDKQESKEEVDATIQNLTKSLKNEKDGRQKDYEQHIYDDEIKYLKNISGMVGSEAIASEIDRINVENQEVKDRINVLTEKEKNNKITEQEKTELTELKERNSFNDKVISELRNISIKGGDYDEAIDSINSSIKSLEEGIADNDITIREKTIEIEAREKAYTEIKADLEKKKNLLSEKKKDAEEVLCTVDKDEVKRCKTKMNDAKDKLEDAEAKLKEKVKVYQDKLKQIASPWIRVVSPMATEGGGTFFKPMVGDEVMVNFESGNVERPYVTGSLYSKNTQVPDERINRTVGPSLHKNASIAIVSPNGHGITFKDPSSGDGFISGVYPGLGVVTDFIKVPMPHTKDLAGGIRIGDRYGLYSIDMSSDKRSVKITSSMGKVTLNAFTGITISAPNGNINIEGKNVSIKAGNNLSLTSGTNIKSDYQYKRDTKLGKFGEFVTEKLAAVSAVVDNFVTPFIDTTLARATLEVFLRPIEGTLCVKSKRYLTLEAGSGKAIVKGDRFKNYDPNEENSEESVFVKQMITCLTTISSKLDKFSDTYNSLWKDAFTKFTEYCIESSTLLKSPNDPDILKDIFDNYLKQRTDYKESFFEGKLDPGLTESRLSLIGTHLKGELITIRENSNKLSNREALCKLVNPLAKSFAALYNHLDSFNIILQDIETPTYIEEMMVEALGIVALDGIDMWENTYFKGHKPTDLLLRTETPSDIFGNVTFFKRKVAAMFIKKVANHPEHEQKSFIKVRFSEKSLTEENLTDNYWWSNFVMNFEFYYGPLISTLLNNTLGAAKESFDKNIMYFAELKDRDVWADGKGGQILFSDQKNATVNFDGGNLKVEKEVDRWNVDRLRKVLGGIK